MHQALCVYIHNYVQITKYYFVTILIVILSYRLITMLFKVILKAIM